MKIYILEKKTFHGITTQVFCTLPPAQAAFKKLVSDTWNMTIEEMRNNIDFENDIVDDNYVCVYEDGESVSVHLYESSTADEPIEMEIQLGDGSRLNVCKGDPLYNEFCVGVFTSSGDYQDLAVVGENYMYSDGSTDPVPIHKEYSVKVYSCEDVEDFTDEFIIPQHDFDPVVDVDLSVKGKISKSEYDKVYKLLREACPNLIVANIPKR